MANRKSDNSAQSHKYVDVHTLVICIGCKNGESFEKLSESRKGKKTASLQIIYEIIEKETKVSDKHFCPEKLSLLKYKI